MDRRITFAAAAVAALGSTLLISSSASAGDHPYEHYRPHLPHYEYRHHRPHHYEPGYRYERHHTEERRYTVERAEPRYYPAPQYRPEYRGPTVVTKPAPVVVRPPVTTVTVIERNKPVTVVAPIVEPPTTPVVEK